MEPVKIVFAVGLMSALAGCGEPLVDADYRGEPILRLVGRISALRGDALATDDEALVSMFWNTDLGIEPPPLVEQQSISTNVQFPNEFEVLVFDPPTEQHLLQNDARLAVGFLLVYADRDGDRIFGAEDAIVGGNIKKALMWATEDVAAADAPFGADIPAGFSLLRVGEMQCEASLSSARLSMRASTTVRMCSSNDDCPRDFSCDTTFRVCVPRDGFDLVIGEDFDLMGASCPGDKRSPGGD